MAYFSQWLLLEGPAAFGSLAVVGDSDMNGFSGRLKGEGRIKWLMDYQEVRSGECRQLFEKFPWKGKEREEMRL